MPRSTVSAILARIGLGKLSALERPEPPNRYEVDARASCCISTSRSWPGSIALATVSPAAAGARRLVVGWEYVYVCIDDATRLAYVEVLNR